MRLKQRTCEKYCACKTTGENFNKIQVFTLFAIMAQIIGHMAEKAYHKIVKARNYEDKLELMCDSQLNRGLYSVPKLHINLQIKTLKDIET
jgi:thymidylate synthase